MLRSSAKPMVVCVDGAKFTPPTLFDDSIENFQPCKPALHLHASAASCPNLSDMMRRLPFAHVVSQSVGMQHITIY